jgi:hypothetical protein
LQLLQCIPVHNNIIKNEKNPFPKVKLFLCQEKSVCESVICTFIIRNNLQGTEEQQEFKVSIQEMEIFLLCEKSVMS